MPVKDNRPTAYVTVDCSGNGRVPIMEIVMRDHWRLKNERGKAIRQYSLKTVKVNVTSNRLLSDEQWQYIRYLIIQAEQSIYIRVS